MTPLEERTAKAIVNIFETGKVSGKYGQVTVVAGDRGHLSYGRSQASLASGNLYGLVRAYCGAPDAACAERLRPFLERLEARDTALDGDAALREALAEAGLDPVMRAVQDDFFDRVYWSPANTYARDRNITLPLGITVVYDSVIHGSWNRIRDRTNKTLGGPAPERQWVETYVATRRAWLASTMGLENTVYRMDTFRALIEEQKWSLELPILVRGVLIDPAALDSAIQRVLSLRQPALAGEDVSRVQQALVREGLLAAGQADGVYGPVTAAAVRRFQERTGLTADGAAGPVTLAALKPY